MAKPPFPNVDYLGRGYDILYTDPLDYASGNQQVKVPVIALQPGSDDSVALDDSSYSYPLGTQHVPDPGGTTDLEFQQLYQATDYLDTFSETATVKAGIPLVAEFTLSESYTSSFSTSSSSKSTTLYVNREVRIETINFTPAEDNPVKQQLSSDFANAIINLPITQDYGQDNSAYAAFIQQFGTHYTTSVSFGGRAYQYTVIEATTYSSMESSGLDIKAGASGSFDIFTASASGSYDQQNTEKYQSATENCTTIKNYSGGKPQDNWDQWVDSVTDSPVPIGLTLAPITDLLTSDYSTDPNIATKQELLLDAIEQYLTDNGKPMPTSQPIPPNSQVYLRSSDGRYLSAQNGNTIQLLDSPDSTTVWGVSGFSELDSGTALALENLGMQAYLNCNLFPIGGQSQAAPVLTAQPEPSATPTLFVSAFGDPAQPQTLPPSAPSQVMSGDQVYVLQTADVLLGITIMTPQVPPYALINNNGQVQFVQTAPVGNADALWTIQFIGVASDEVKEQSHEALS